MRIVFVEIRNFRGIKQLDWAPAAGLNCLIGPGDSTKTTILDAIELALTPRSLLLADDSDFFDGKYDQAVKITVTCVALPSQFLAEDKYGMHTRGWHEGDKKIQDESGTGLMDALSFRVTIDESLEPRWSLFNLRISEEVEDPPGLRYKDSRLIAPTRLGPYAERHLGWGRHSVLSKISDKEKSVSLQLATAGRAARESFRATRGELFKAIVGRAEQLSREYSVGVREGYTADLDVHEVAITTGGISLHDANLPLRRLGTGSSRLLVAALQHDQGASQIPLIDEVEHGLEPHRIARLLSLIKQPLFGQTAVPQAFLTTHSPVVILELKAAEIFRVLSRDGITTVASVADAMPDDAQAYLRASPEAFLARRILVGEGRTEQGLLRGLDGHWTGSGMQSMALRGAIAVDGRGNSQAPTLAEHLLDLGYDVFVLLDTDKPAPADTVQRVRDKAGFVHEWPDKCSTEERVFLDVSWPVVNSLISAAIQKVGEDSVRDSINNTLRDLGAAPIKDLTLPSSLDDQALRRAIGITAHKKEWFKSIDGGERMAREIAVCISTISTTPLATGLKKVREWLDA